MKIEILLTSTINEKCTGGTCFVASSEYISKEIATEKRICGVVIIDGTTVKFSFSPMGMDGDIFTDDANHRMIIIHVIPLYVLANKSYSSIE